MKHLLIIIMYLIAIQLVSCSKPEKIKESYRPVKYSKVVAAGAYQERTFTGTAKAGTEIRLSFKVSGTVFRFDMRVGQKVRKNSLIATLDDADYILEYEKADAAVKNADVQEKNLKSNFKRLRQLYENGNASLNDYEAAKAQFESSKANEKSAKKARRLAKSQLDYTKLYAPVSGVVATVDIEKNENIRSGQQIVMLQSEGDLEVSVGVPESFISRIKVQDEVDIKFSSIPGSVYPGIVSEVSYTINRETSTYPLTVKISDQSTSVRPGMAANVTFKFANEEGDDKMLVSANAVGEDQNGNFVFVLEPVGGEIYLARKRYVQIGKLKTNGFEIEEGLIGNELIATAGLQTLLDSMKVKLL